MVIECGHKGVIERVIEGDYKSLGVIDGGNKLFVFGGNITPM